MFMIMAIINDYFKHLYKFDTCNTEIVLKN